MLTSIIVLVILIMINGILSSSEIAFLSLNKIKLKEDVNKKDKKALLIDKNINNPSSFLSTIQIGITLAGFLASAFASDYYVDYFINYIKIPFISENILRILLVIIITMILSYFTLIFGELVPKRIAINNPYKIAKRFVGFVNVIRIVFYPLVKLLTISTEGVCKLLKVKENKDRISEEDIKKMILLGKEEGIIEEKEKEYILNIFNFNDIPVKKVMTPVEDVVLIDGNDNIKNIILRIKETKFSRYPVYKDDINNIIGTLNVKDLIINKSENDIIDINSIIRETHRFEYNEKIDDVFRYMQELNESLCPIYKKDKFIGIITIEDAVEEIVGNIYDEYDEESENDD